MRFDSTAFGATTGRTGSGFVSQSEPGVIAGKRFANLLYGTGAYGNSVTGNSESIAHLSAEAVRQFYETNYIPRRRAPCDRRRAAGNTAIVVAGDIDALRCWRSSIRRSVRTRSRASVWQTVLFAGYGDDRVLNNVGNDLVKLDRSFFFKVSYAIQR